MTGGFAYVLDQSNDFEKKYNDELIDLHRMDRRPDHANYLRNVIEEFVLETRSQWGQRLLDDFDVVVKQFWLVKPKASSIDQLLDHAKPVQDVA
jgi:glutamate synthase (NADPH/NADH) large chain